MTIRVRPLTIAVLASLLLVALATTASAQQTFTNSPAVAIPDGPAEGIQDTITVSSGPTAIGSMRITVDIAHTWDSDLAVWLLPPGVNWPGTRTSASESDAVIAGAIQLFNRIGGSGQNFTSVAFTAPGDSFDPGTTLIPDDSAQAPFTGTWYPQDLGHFRTLYGSDSNGDWKLVVYDNVGADSGTLNSWSLQLTQDASVPVDGGDDDGGSGTPQPTVPPVAVGANGCNASVTGAGEPALLLTLLLVVVGLLAVRRR